MKYCACFCVLLLAIVLATPAFAADYAALEGRELYLGGGLLYLTGDDPHGEDANEIIPAVKLFGLSDTWTWQVFLGASFDGGALAAGGAADYLLSHNFDDSSCCPTTCGTCSSCEPDLWWIGAGPAVIAYQDMFTDIEGDSYDCTEFGVHAVAGMTRGNLALDLNVFYFLDTCNLMVSAGVATAID